jgi:hypothetical protein
MQNRNKFEIKFELKNLFLRDSRREALTTKRMLLSGRIVHQHMYEPSDHNNHVLRYEAKLIKKEK